MRRSEGAKVDRVASDSSTTDPLEVGPWARSHGMPFMAAGCAETASLPQRQSIARRSAVGSQVSGKIGNLGKTFFINQLMHEGVCPLACHEKLANLARHVELPKLPSPILLARPNTRNTAAGEGFAGVPEF